MHQREKVVSPLVWLITRRIVASDGFQAGLWTFAFPRYLFTGSSSCSLPSPASRNTAVAVTDFVTEAIKSCCGRCPHMFLPISPAKSFLPKHLAVLAHRDCEPRNISAANVSAQFCSDRGEIWLR